MADDSGIDPRYAAQFQRGYDPARHAPAAPTVASGPTRVVGGPPAAVERVPPPPPLVERPEGAVPTPEVAESEAPVASTSAVASRLLRWALPIAATMLLLASAAVFQDALNDERLYSGYADSAGYIWSQVRNSLPGPLFVAGIVALTSWLVLLGLRSPGRSS